jgi:ParB family chromosome partitioning protein
MVELTIVLAASRTNAPQVLKEAAAVYKVDTDAITAKVKQEFAAKQKEHSAKKGIAKVQSKAAKRAKAA